MKAKVLLFEFHAEISASARQCHIMDFNSLFRISAIVVQFSKLAKFNVWLFYNTMQ